MIKTFFPIFVVIMFFAGCATTSPPPKAKNNADFILKGSTEEGDMSAVTERKRALYHALKERSGQGSIVIIYDASGSMVDKSGEKGQRKFEAAYQGLYHIGSLLGVTDDVKLLVFGSTKPFGLMKDGSVYRHDYHRAMEAAGDVKLVYSCVPGRFDRREFNDAIKYLEGEKSYKGDTPIGYAVLKAHEYLKGLPNARVILITDGEETGPQLAQAIAMDRKQEIKLRREFQNYNDLTVAAADAIKGLVNDNIYFTPILYGLKGSGDSADAVRTREYFKALADKSGSIYIEAMTPIELLNAFMDAELMSLQYSLYNNEGDKKHEAARGRIGLPLTVKEGSYTLRIHLQQPLEYTVDLRPGEKNIYVLIADEAGRISLNRSK